MKAMTFLHCSVCLKKKKIHAESKTIMFGREGPFLDRSYESCMSEDAHSPSCYQA